MIELKLTADLFQTAVTHSDACLKITLLNGTDGMKTSRAQLCAAGESPSSRRGLSFLAVMSAPGPELTDVT